MGDTGEQVTISTEVVLDVQREKIAALTWELTLLAARCRQAETQLAELMKTRGDGGGGDG